MTHGPSIKPLGSGIIHQLLIIYGDCVPKLKKKNRGLFRVVSVGFPLNPWRATGSASSTSRSPRFNHQLWPSEEDSLMHLTAGEKTPETSSLW